MHAMLEYFLSPAKLIGPFAPFADRLKGGSDPPLVTGMTHLQCSANLVNYKSGTLLQFLEQIYVALSEAVVL